MKGVYVHIPFCKHKCTYCDFYSLEGQQDHDTFVHMLCREIELRSAQLSADDVFDTIFIGGGTPSLLSAQHMHTILDCLHKCLNIQSIETTSECNPGAVTNTKLRDFRSMGIDRLSFGVQSFHQEELDVLTRIHSADEARHAIAHARDAGFDNVNLDLIFAVPGQTMARWQSTLEYAVACETDHISAYSLIFEEGTKLNAQKLKGLVQPLPEDLDADMYEYSLAFLAEKGYSQYEVSNHALPGKQCQHNLKYWHGTEYVSFGPSAHGYLHSTRYANVRSLKAYVSSLQEFNLPVVSTETLSEHTKLSEEAFLRLRADGIEMVSLEKKYGVSLASMQPWLQDMQSAGLLEVQDSHIHMTSRGYLMSNTLSADFIHELERSVLHG